jgi:hypothetical protein
MALAGKQGVALCHEARRYGKQSSAEAALM